MDISFNKLTNSYINKESAGIERENQKVDSFKSVLESAQLSGDKGEIKEAAIEIESYFLGQMFKQMYKSNSSINPEQDKTFAREVFEEMLFDEYSRMAAESGGIGLAERLYEQLVLDLE